VDAGADDDGGNAGGADASLSPALCDTVMSGLANEGRSQLQGCLTKNNCASDMFSCLNQVAAK
jgi:hypothetical protein